MSASWRLRVERGPNAGRSFPLDRASATIGRQDNNAIVLDDARLSRQHARIDSGPNGLTVTDLGSANGTQVNGRTVTGSVAINAGDRVQLGDTILLVEGGPGPVGPAPAATIIAGPGPGGAVPPSPIGSEIPRLTLQGTGEVFRLDRPRMVIGRLPDNELPLEDTQASRQHARFDTRDGQVTVTDLGSANGTRVNGNRITAPTTLNNGDVVQIGTSQLRVEGIAIVDHGTAAALGFYPPPAGASLESAPGSSPAPFGPPPAEGATVLGGPPPMAGLPSPSSTPPNIMAGPPAGSPGGSAQPWASPPAPPFGGAPPPIQPPAPPAMARRRRNPLPLILGGFAVFVLLICLGGGFGALALSRRNSSPTATPAVAGTAVPAAATAMPAAGSSGGNTAPPPPGAAPTSTVPSAAPTAAALPSAAPSVAAALPTAAPARTAVPSARATTAPASGNRRVLSVESVGLRFSIPADWTQTTNEAGRAQFRSPDGRAQIVVRWSSQAPAGLTAQQVIRQELTDTAGVDPSFDSTAVGTGSVTVGGQPGYGTEIYTFAQQSGARVSEADRAVVLPGRAQYFFGFLAVESAFQTYAATFDEIIGTIQITGP